MLKRIAPICLSVTLATWAHAQDAAPAPPAPPLTSRAVMTGDQVVRILDETVDWYRMLGIQQQSATQPSDLLILYANRQTADRVVALAFELARANAQLPRSQSERAQAEEPDSPATPRRLPAPSKSACVGSASGTSPPMCSGSRASSRRSPTSNAARTRFRRRSPRLARPPRSRSRRCPLAATRSERGRPRAPRPS